MIKQLVLVASLLAVASDHIALSATTGEANGPLDPNLERFVVEKRALAKRLAEKYRVSVPEIVWKFYDAAQRGDRHATTNSFYKIEAGTEHRGGPSSLPHGVWCTVHETFGASEQFHTWKPKLLYRFGNAILQKVPAESMYFGGTDAGRFIVSALSASHTEGRPFMTLTQNQPADTTYLDYIREFCGGKIYVPTINDSKTAFEEYFNDVNKRRQKNQLKEDEEVKIVNDRVQVSGVVAVMAINEILVRMLVDRNPSVDIYLEESLPLESLYGQSLPHGLIFKVNHKPLEELPYAVVEADHRFWTDECNTLIGKVVDERTSVSELCSWTKKHFLPPDPNGFGPNPDFVKDAQAPQYWSQCRSAIAGYYHWWSKKLEKEQSDGFAREADFAFRQAVSLSPYNPAVAWRYTEYLLQHQRTNDAKILIETTLKTEPEKRMEIDSDMLKGAMKKLRREAKRLSLNQE